MATINELPLITVAQLEDNDLIYLVDGSASGSGDRSMTVAEFNKSNLPAVYCVAVWGGSDQDTDTYNTWFQVTGWSATPGVDTYNMWDSANNRIVIQSDLEGAFWISAGIRHDRRIDDDCDRIIVSIRKNGGEVSRASKDTQDWSSPTGANYDTGQVHYLDPAAVAGDYYEVYMYLQVASTFFDEMAIKATAAVYQHFSAVRVAGRDEV